MKRNHRFRRMRTQQILFAVIIIVLPFVAADAIACQCRERKPPCAEYGEAAAVFSGSVTKITSTPMHGPQTIHFNIDQAFRGVSGSVIELLDIGNSCRYDFEERKKYLVYAYRTKEGDKLYTHYCTRTREISEADADLAYLNSLSNSTQAAEIVGFLGEDNKTLREVEIVARSGKKSYRSLSDKGGWFRLTLPGPGSYRVRMVLPLYSNVVGMKEELDQISKFMVLKTGIAVEYHVSLEPGKCFFINPPLFVASIEYQKHGGLNPLIRRKKR